MTAFDDPCMRPRYRNMTDPHEGNDGDGPLGIRVISYLGDYDDYFDCEVIAPYGSEVERDADIRRLSSLPGVYGRLEFEPCTLSLRQLGWTRFDAEPSDVARATTFREFMAGFKHDDDWLDEDDSDDESAAASAVPASPGDMTLDGLGSLLEALGLFPRTCFGSTLRTCFGPTGSRPRAHRREEPAGHRWGQMVLPEGGVGPEEVGTPGPEPVAENTRTAVMTAVLLDADPITRLRAEALFASDLQPSQHPDTALICKTVIKLVFNPGEAGCAARVAQEFGEHPEAACCRMAWAREAVYDAFAVEVAR